MLKIFICLLLFVNNFLVIQAQSDPDAQRILDNLSKKVKSLNSLKINFSLIIENHQNGENQKYKGDLLIKGEKYKVNIKKHMIFFDGKNVYNYLPDSKEVTISRPSKNDDELFYQNPLRLINSYTKKFKYRLLGESTLNKKNCYEIDLYPIDINKKYSIIKLLIDVDQNMLVGAKMIMKSGIHYMLYVDSFNTNVKALDSDFFFDTQTNKDVEVIDLRK